jgi:hypothetical protein
MSRIPKKLAGRGVAACSVTAALVTMAATPAHASWQAATTGASGVNIRDCYHPTVQLPPSTNCTLRVAVPAHTGVRIVCQAAGQSIDGNPVWDYVVWEGGPGRPEGFASDYYIDTGSPSWIPGIDICH